MGEGCRRYSFRSFVFLISGSVGLGSVLICFISLDFRPGESTPSAQSRGSVWVVRPFNHGARDRVFRPAPSRTASSRHRRAESGFGLQHNGKPDRAVAVSIHN